MKKFKPRFNTDRLKCRGTRQMYCEAVRRRLEENGVEEKEEIEELWEAQRKAYMESARLLAKFNVHFTNDECTKMYFTFMCLDRVLFSGRGRDFHTTEYRVWAFRKF